MRHRGSTRLLVRFTSGEEWISPDEVQIRRSVPHRQWRTTPWHTDEQVYARNKWGTVVLTDGKAQSHGRASPGSFL